MSSWSCTACTFLNPDQGDGKCMICRTSNPSPTPVTNMSCPICGKNNFSLSEIQSHVNACLSGGVPTPAVATVSPFSPPSNNMIDLTGVSNNINNSSDTSDSKMTTTATTTTTTTTTATAPKSLTSEHQVTLLQRTLNLKNTSNSYHNDLLSILKSIKQHIDAEELEEQEQNAKGQYHWEFQSSTASKYNNNTWKPFSDAENISIESDRRRGLSSAQIIDTSGATITINFNTLLDSRNFKIRAVPNNKRYQVDETKQESSSSSSSSSLNSKSSSTKFHFIANNNTCGACMSEFNESDSLKYTDLTCGHDILSKECMSMYITTKINEKNIYPWINCPSNDCNVNIECENLLNIIPLSTLQHLCETYLEKWVVRFPEWTPCVSSSCKSGFLVTNSMENKKLHFSVCNKQQIEKRKKEEQDESLKKMIADGTLRPCPKCKLLTMKEFGVCNVIDCQQCGIVWNWQTRETGRTSRELKQKARAKGTLWGHGELAYQQQLQRTNKKEFIALLARNGVKYDPNYRRGT